ncbi:MAG: fibrobacter succinogenes major paralogous domain-containing protein, partial [bacterium]
VISCSKTTAPEEGLPSFDLNALPWINDPPDHFRVHGRFTMIGAGFECYIWFPTDSVWRISVETSPKNGVQVLAGIVIGTAHIAYVTELVSDSHPDPTLAGFKSCFVHHFVFRDDEYTTVRTVDFEFKRTGMSYDEATVAVGDTVPCDSVHIVIDIDHNIYRTVKIGSQVWMAENLKVSHFRNGEPIIYVGNDYQWGTMDWEAYCDYDNNAYWIAPGHLYNWYAVTDYRELAPRGWHVATDSDWKQLEMYLGMDALMTNLYEWRGTDQGTRLKTKLDQWIPNGTDEVEFAALPGGCRDSTGLFFGRHSSAWFWSSSEGHDDRAIYRYLDREEPGIYRAEAVKRSGFSVRCVRD